MKKISAFLILLFLVFSIGVAQDNEYRFHLGDLIKAKGLALPTYVAGQYLTNNGTTLSWGAISFVGYLRADGTVPLTADWAMGAFNLTQAGWHGQTIAADHGGTGLASYAIGDILHATGTTTIGKLADVAVGQVLASGGVGAVPAYTASPTLTGNFGASNITANPTLEANLLTNGNFSIDPTGTNTPWMEGTSTNIGTAWVWSAGVLRHATASTTTLRQVISATSGQLLKVMFTIAQDGATPIAGTIKATVGGTSSDGVSDTITVAAGTYTRWLYATGTSTYYVTFTSSTTLTATIDDISVQVATEGVLTAARVTSTGQILGIVGSKSLPSFSFIQDQSTGIYLTEPSQMFIALGGYKRFTFGLTATGCDSNNFYIGSSTGAILVGSTTATLQLGLSTAAPVDQAIVGPSGLGADKPGGMIDLRGGQSTGTANGGSVRIQTSTTSTTSSTANTEYTRYRAVGKVVTLTDAAATDVVSFAVTAGQTVGGMLIYTIKVQDDDASDFQVESGTVIFCGLQDEANWHTNISEVSTQALESGALATTWAIDTATANTLKITCLADSDLTTPVITLRYQLFLNSPIVETI